MSSLDLKSDGASEPVAIHKAEDVQSEPAAVALQVEPSQRLTCHSIDQIILGRIACREFSDQAVPRQLICEILEVARFAPSGANIQPWNVYVVAGETRQRLSAALLDAHRTARAEHSSEYKYYSDVLPAPYRERRQEFGRIFYGSLGISPEDVEARANQTAKNYAFFGAPVGLIVTIDRRLEAGSWLDLGMFVQNMLLAAASRGLQTCPQETFAKYHRVLREHLLIPEEQIVVCGVSIGYGKEGAMRTSAMPRVQVDEFTRFVGFDS